MYEFVTPTPDHVREQGIELWDSSMEAVGNALKAYDERLDLALNNKWNRFVVYYTQASGLRERVLVWANEDGSFRELSMGIVEAVKALDQEGQPATWEQIEANRQAAAEAAQKYEDEASRNLAKDLVRHIAITRPDLIHSPRVSMSIPRRVLKRGGRS